MEAPNVLILDEPTNDLDIRTLTILEDYLDHFDGIVITVSHDRYFLDRIVRRIFAFENGTINQYEGGYTDYQLRKAFEKQTSQEVNTFSNSDKSPKPTKTLKTRQEKLKFSYKEQKEYETIEDEISELEAKISDLDDQILKNASDYGKLNKLTIEKNELESKLEEKMDRWMYLQDLAERIENQ
jgi:ATP-binding cassette subfamily F protein uup